jgi:hypothetical protein
MLSGILIPLIATYLGVSEQVAQEIFYAGMALILGQGSCRHWKEITDIG